VIDRVPRSYASPPRQILAGRLDEDGHRPKDIRINPTARRRQVIALSPCAQKTAAVARLVYKPDGAFLQAGVEVFPHPIRGRSTGSHSWGRGTIAQVTFGEFWSLARIRPRWWLKASVEKPLLIPLYDYREYPSQEMEARACAFYEEMRRRRTVRHFSSRAVPRAVIERCVAAAGTAPSGANQQPWHFVVVEDPEIKHRIRVAAEVEEREFYSRRATEEWLAALAPLGTDADKSFLETAPYLIAVFAQPYEPGADGRKVKHYYVTESVGIAAGLLIAALHYSGLATLTHTPSPMAFLSAILERPPHERPFLLIVTGYPAQDARVPAISKKPLDEIASFR